MAIAEIVSRDINLARARLFHMVAELKASPDSPSALMHARHFEQELNDLGDDGAAYRRKVEDLLAGKASTRRKRRR